MPEFSIKELTTLTKSFYKALAAESEKNTNLGQALRAGLSAETNWSMISANSNLTAHIAGMNWMQQKPEEIKKHYPEISLTEAFKDKRQNICDAWIKLTEMAVKDYIISIDAKALSALMSFKSEDMEKITKAYEKHDGASIAKVCRAKFKS